MKRILLLLTVALGMSSCGIFNFNQDRLMQSGAKLAQALSITDNDIKGYVTQSIEQLDAQNKVVTSGSYVTRLNRIVKGINSVNGTPLTFKVYQTNEVNAFACADGNVRVYTGLMDVMDDNEVLGVIGHEIGHVALQHSLNAYKEALYTSAALDAIAATGSAAAALSDSVLGQLAQSMISAKFSRKQETQADDYGYDFMKAQGKNPYYMSSAFEQLLRTSDSGTQTQISSIQQLFSSHPDTASRIERVNKKAAKDGYTKPVK